MADRADDEHWQQPALPLEVGGYRSPSGPPPTREDCASLPRPCPRTSCPHNLQREDEPAGRPSDGQNGRRMPIRVVQREASCSLDVAEAHLDGMTPREVGRMLGVTDRRVLQLEQRGAVKQRLAHDLLRLLEAFRERLPDGVELTVETPRHGATHSVLVVLTLEEAAIPSVARSLGVIRRRRERP